MRIVCDSCGKKYAISDDKVRGKLFKIRCKKCSQIIIVQGNLEQPAPREERTRVFDYGPNAEAVATGVVKVSDADWFYVKDGQQTGPFIAGEIDAFFGSKEIDVDTYVWREGQDDWYRLADVKEFAHLIPAHIPEPQDDFEQSSAQSTTAAPINEVMRQDEPEPQPPPPEQSSQSSGALEDEFLNDSANYQGEEEATQVHTNVSDDKAEFGAQDHDLFAARAETPAVGNQPVVEAETVAAAVSPFLNEDLEIQGSSGADQDSFLDEPEPTTDNPLYPTEPEPSSSTDDEHYGGAAAEMDASSISRRSHPELEGLVDARNEDSVLFSLDSLSEFNAGDEKPEGEDEIPTTTGSGLIDIRALASAHTSDGGPSSMDSVVPQAVMPLGQRQSNKTLFVFIGLAVLIIAALVMAIVFVVLDTGKTEDDTNGELATGELNGEGNEVTSAGTGEAVGEPSGGANPELAMAGTPEVSPELLMAMTITAYNVGNSLTAAQTALAAATPVEETQPTARNEEEESSRSERGSRRSERDSSRSERSSSRSERSSSSSDDESSSEDDAVSDALQRIRGRTDDDEEESGSSSDRGSRTAENETSSETESVEETLTTRDISRTVRRYRRRLSDCRNEANLTDGEVLSSTVTITIQSSGSVSSARSGSSGAGHDCVVSVVRDMRFPSFSGETMEIQYPFRVR